MWQQVCLNEVADLGKKYNPDLDEKVRDDPKQWKLWSEKRNLTPAFLETIVLHEPYRGALRRQGIRIVGARFLERVDLSGARISRSLSLEKSRLEKGADFGSVTAPQGISLEKTTFVSLDENSAAVSFKSATIGSLNLSGALVTSSLDVGSVTIGGELDLSYSKFPLLDGRHMEVGGNLRMDGCVVLTSDQPRRGVYILNAKIGGTLSMNYFQFPAGYRRGRRSYPVASPRVIACANCNQRFGEIREIGVTVRNIEPPDQR